MTRDELLALAEKHAMCTSEDHKEFLHDGLMAFAAEISAAERRKHQNEIERWKAEAATAEKWRGLAMAREGANGRVIQEVQEEAATATRESCIQACDAMPLPAEFSREGSWAWECGVNACIDAIRAKAAK